MLKETPLTVDEVNKYGKDIRRLFKKWQVYH